MAVPLRDMMLAGATALVCVLTFSAAMYMELIPS